MKSLKSFIKESYTISHTNVELDKSVKTPERKKVYNAIYDKLDSTKVNGHLYRDENWEGVKLVRKDVNDALEELNSKLKDGYRYEMSIAADNGGYRKSNDGMSQWKQYKVELYKVHKDIKEEEELVQKQRQEEEEIRRQSESMYNLNRSIQSAIRNMTMLLKSL